MSDHNLIRLRSSLLAAAIVVSSVCYADSEPLYPPTLPGGKSVVTDTSKEFLKQTTSLKQDVEVAKTPAVIDFLYYPQQTYPGNPWSVWGDGISTGGKYYSAIGDHRAPQGNAFVYEYNPNTKTLRTIVNVKKLLNLPEGHYMPGKIHSRIDMGSDGWLYFSTHRGSTRVTIDKYHYKGDWIIRHHPGSGKSEIIAHAPVPKHCIPTSVLDPERLIFYGGTVAGNRIDPVMFFAYDIRKRKVLHTVPDGPYRYLIFAKSTGRIYYVNKDGGPLMRYDPSTGKPPVRIKGSIGLRSATRETADGYVYTVSTRDDATLWQFNTQTEEIKNIGNAAVGSQTYVASLDVDPTGRYLYYVPGAHGGSRHDGTPVVQFDIKKRTKKVIAFLHPFYKEKYGYVPMGTFGSAVSEKGDKLYITWNGNRGGPDRRGRLGFDTCALTVIHIPEAERRLTPQLPKLRKELLERSKKDQEIRRNPDLLKVFAQPIEKNKDIKALDNPHFQKMLQIDRDNREWLKQVVKKHGWPGKTLVGSDGAHSAWLLVQHATQDLAFQQQCLKLMQKAQKGEVAAVKIAYLLDRVRLAEGKKQRYGTQVKMKNGTWVVRDVEDPSQLDQRRKEVGLPPIKEYLQSIQKLFDLQNRLGSSRNNSPQPR